MNMKIVIKLLRNSQYSKSDNFKKLSILAQILSFLSKITCTLPFSKGTLDNFKPCPLGELCRTEDKIIL